MSDIQPFIGFPQQSRQFLADLAANNNREWFEAHKQEYRRYLLEPALAFVVALGEQLRTLSDAMVYDTRTNGSGSIMRIHRDTRFSADKSPYKTNLGILFWQGPRKKIENPGFFFHMDAHNAVIYAGMHTFPPWMLAAYRHAVVDEQLGAELAAAIESIRKAGAYEVGGRHYKRVPKGYDPAHTRADLLCYNGLYASAPSIDPTVLATPDLVETCLAHCRSMTPLHQWLVKVSQSGNL